MLVMVLRVLSVEFRVKKGIVGREYIKILRFDHVDRSECQSETGGMEGAELNSRWADNHINTKG